MELVSKRISKGHANVTVSLSEKEVAKYGEKYSAEEKFAVDTHVKSNGEHTTRISKGEWDSEESQNNYITYVVTSESTEDGKYDVMFDLTEKVVNGQRVPFAEGAPIEYKIQVAKAAYFRDAVEKFIRFMVKDQHLSFQ